MDVPTDWAAAASAPRIQYYHALCSSDWHAAVVWNGYGRMAAGSRWNYDAAATSTATGTATGTAMAADTASASGDTFDGTGWLRTSRTWAVRH